MKLWKSKWKRELDNAAPKLNADVLNQPINATQSVSPAGQFVPLVRRKPFVWSMSAAVAVVLIAVVLCVTLITPASKIDTFVFAVDINPSVVISTDANGNVTGIMSLNDDADVVLSSGGSRDVLGKPLSNAVNWYVDCAAMLGYLNVDKTSAVRISTVDGGDNLLNGARAELEQYFQNQGYMSFVVEDKLDLAAFTERAGLNGLSSVKDIAQYVSTKNSLLSYRNADGLTNDQLQNAYRQYVDSDVFADAVTYYLQSIVDDVNQRKQDIAAIQSLYEQIYNHSDNVGLLSKDYWNVKIYDGTGRYSAEFGALMKQMDDALSAYKANYGVDITNKIQLEAIAVTLDGLPIEEVVGLLDRFTVSLLKQSVTLVSQVLSSLGEEDNVIARIVALPSTVEEFTGKVSTLLDMENASRIKWFSEAYNAERNKISVADYNERKQALLSQYGSMENMWDKLK